MQSKEYIARAEKEIFYSKDSSFGIYSMTVIDNIVREKKKVSIKGVDISCLLPPNEKIQLKGSMMPLSIGVEYTITSETKVDAKYGKYENLVSIKPNVNCDSSTDQLQYLSTITTPGIAKKILDSDSNFINNVVNGEHQLSVTGVNHNTYKKIVETVKDTFATYSILQELGQFNLNVNTLKKLQKSYPDIRVLIEDLKKNPYIIIKNVEGFGFKKVDEIALQLNPKFKVSVERLTAYLIHTMYDNSSNDGHTVYKFSKIKDYISRDYPEMLAVFALNHSKFSGEGDGPFMIIDDTIGLRSSYNQEMYIYSKLKLIDSLNREILMDYNKGIKATESHYGYSLTEEQKNAIKTACEKSVCIITGSAGTGKSTIIKAICESCHESVKYALTALSAKAAQRIQEVSGKHATTIHRLLKFTGVGFEMGENNQLSEDLIIVDESSMINSYLFYKLLQAVKPEAKIIIVFDNAQLPPIGAGNVAFDLMSSEFNHVHLNKIHRQAEMSGIIVDSNKIRKGISPFSDKLFDSIHGELKDISYTFIEDKEQIIKASVMAYLESIKYYGINNVSIITPRRNSGVICSFKLNELIGELLHGNKPYVLKRNIKYREGSIVIQRENDYGNNVINGEIGNILSIDTIKNTVLVRFKDYIRDCNKDVEYSGSMFGGLELAYVNTVHSFQGSQMDKIIVVMDKSQVIMLDTCLLYTAITRAKKECSVICDKSSFEMSIKHNKIIHRNTFLCMEISKNKKVHEI